MSEDFMMSGDPPIKDQVEHPADPVERPATVLPSPDLHEFAVARALSNSALIRFPAGTSASIPSYVQAFADAVQEATGAHSFGTYPGHSPDMSHALDIHVPVSPPDLGNLVAEFSISNMERFGIWYVIWRQRIYNPERASYWRNMEDRGSITQNHFDHVHVSFYDSAPNPEPTEELTVGQYEELNARIDGLNAKQDELLLLGQHNKAVLEEWKREVGDALGQANWHQSGEAANAVIESLFTILGDIKKAVVK